MATSATATRMNMNRAYMARTAPTGAVGGSAAEVPDPLGDVVVGAVVGGQHDRQLLSGGDGG